MAVVIDRSIESVKGNPLRGWSAIRHTLKSMTRVHLSAKVEATAARGQESSIGMCGQGAETETTSGGSESCLSPLIVIRVKTSELLEARPDGSIESLQSMGMIARWNDPYAVDHLAETGTASEQLKGDLGIRNVAQRLEKLSGFADSAESVLVAKLRRSDRTS